MMTTHKGATPSSYRADEPCVLKDPCVIAAHGRDDAEGRSQIPDRERAIVKENEELQAGRIADGGGTVVMVVSFMNIRFV